MNPIIAKYKDKFRRDGFIYKFCKKMYVSFRNVFYPYGYIRNYVLFPIGAFFRVHHIRPFYDQNAKKLEELKDIHKGKRCFIVATGPSLRIEDVEKLDGEITIGVNSLYRLYDRTSFRPTYYTVLDTDVQKTVDEHLEAYEIICREQLFFNSMMKSKHPGILYIPICYQNHWFNLYTPGFNYAKNLRYNTDLVWGIYDKYTVTNCAIDLAIYLGCKEIYLLGVDCNYTGPKVYFDDTSTTEPSNEKKEKGYYTQKAMMTAYRFMDTETKKRDIHIFNATRGGMLEEFVRVNFDELF